MQLALFGGLNGRLPYAPKSIAHVKIHILIHSNNLVEAYQVNNLNISCFILKKMMPFSPHIQDLWLQNTYVNYVFGVMNF